MKILILHGPLLDKLGTREPSIYGTTTLAILNQNLHSYANEAGAELTIHQSNVESELVEFVANCSKDHQAIVINPAAFTHTSIALRDALIACEIPVVEVHLSNVAAREPFRAHSLISPVVDGTIFGLGVLGYEVALSAVIKKLRKM